MFKKYYLYPCFVIDYGWSTLPSIDDIFEMQHKRHKKHQGDGYCVCDISRTEVEEVLNEAVKVAKEQSYFEGDFMNGPGVFLLPFPNDSLFRFEYGFAWKQRNNGSTFIVSPVPLDWLEDEFGNDRIEFNMLD